MIEYYKRTVKDPDIRKIKNFQVGCLISVVNPSEEEIDYLEKEYNLDKQNLISGLDENEVPRAEFEKKAAYIVLKVNSASSESDLDTFLIIIGDSFIFTLSKKRPKFMTDILGGNIRFITTQKTSSLLILLSLMNKEFEKTTLQIVRSVNQKKKDINDMTEKDLDILLEHENTLNNLISVYDYTNHIYNKLIKNLDFFKQDVESMEDLTIEAKQGFDICKSSLKTISNLRNHQVIILSNRLNKVITLLTLFTIFISIPAAVSGIYGMNLILPFQENPNAFYFIIAGIAAFWIIMIAVFRKMKIL